MCGWAVFFWPLVTVQESRRGLPWLGKFKEFDVFFPSAPDTFEMKRRYKKTLKTYPSHTLSEPGLWEH